MVADPRIVSIATSELSTQDLTKRSKKTAVQSKLLEHINASTDFYAGRFLRYLKMRRDEGTLQQAVLSALMNAAQKPRRKVNPKIRHILDWSRLRVWGKSIYVPMAAAESVASIFNLSAAVKKKYLGALGRIEKIRIKHVCNTRDAYVFLGTHIEAAPGKCKLPDIVSP
jgi:hypothetical protein